MLALQYDNEKAIRASYEDGVESVAINLINMGMTSEKVQEATKLPIERIKELTINLSHKMENTAVK